MNIQSETYAKLEKLIDEHWEAAKIFYKDPEIPRQRIERIIYGIYGLCHLVDEGTHLKPIKKEESNPQTEYADAI